MFYHPQSRLANIFISNYVYLITYVDETELAAKVYNDQAGFVSQLLSQESTPSHWSVEDNTASDYHPYHSNADGLPSIISAPLAAQQQYATAASPSGLLQTNDKFRLEVLPLKSRQSPSDSRKSLSNGADVGSGGVSIGNASPQLASLYLTEPVWPLRSASEAMLLRHFTRNLAPWIDLCDPLTLFQGLVPRRAGTCPVLLNAIFALAARHLSHTSGYDNFAANRYHDKCLNSFIPLFQHRAVFSDENLFAATVILQILEQMEVKNIGLDTKSYLLSIYQFVSHGGYYIKPRNLSAAAFWAGLRQDIYSAAIGNQPVRVNIETPIVDRSLEPINDDAAWANRAVAHCADVLNFCFSQNHDVFPSLGSTSGTFSTTERWHRLREWGRAWQMFLPKSFVPILDRKRSEKEAFPEHHIQHLVRCLCGIGVHNKWSPPALFTACIGVAASNTFVGITLQSVTYSRTEKTRKHFWTYFAVLHEIMRGRLNPSRNG
ncbi:hypothetical protein MCOR34_011915 [Pyricularia oryzae]|nr:hypothetical protein MCOR34_011915 [Pyricularia oryzae]